MSTATIQPGKYVTPHCGLGAHENAKVLSEAGTLRPSCRGEYVYRFVTVTCNCWCHEMFRTMRAQQAAASSGGDDGMPDADTPATVALGPLEPVVTGGSSAAGTAPIEAKQDFWVSVSSDDDLAPQVARYIKKHMLDTEVTDEPKSKDDEGKRRARGSLDINVEAVCRLWLAGKLPYEHLTPADIGMMIDVSNPPSAGAVYAVLQRWKEHGFVELGNKPFRFVRFTSTVAEQGISFAKDAMSREKNARAKGFF